MVLNLGSIEPLEFVGQSQGFGRASKKHIYVLNLKKKSFHFSLKRGSVNPHMKLVGFVKNHWS